MKHSENHKGHRTGWLRASVLGANDGIISTACLILGVAASGAETKAIVIAGAASLVAGAASMAAGEYVSVSSQADTEQADLARETLELASNPQAEHAELTSIYVQRGLDTTLAAQVATQLMRRDALEAHARDELGLTEQLAARPMQAALSSAAAFAVGAALPLVALLIAPTALKSWVVAIASVSFLALLGFTAAQAGSSSPYKAIGRTVLWGVLAMALTTAIGKLVGTVV